MSGQHFKYSKISINEPYPMAHAYNVSPWEPETEGSKAETLMSYMEGSCLKKPKQNVKGISRYSLH